MDPVAVANEKYFEMDIKGTIKNFFTDRLKPTKPNVLTFPSSAIQTVVQTSKDRKIMKTSRIARKSNC